jgi:hypothetical protein
LKTAHANWSPPRQPAAVFSYCNIILPIVIAVVAGKYIHSILFYSRREAGRYLLASKVFEFAESFSKLASSNPLLLLVKRFLRVAPRAFATSQGQSCRFWNPKNRFPINNYFLERGSTANPNF